MNSHFVTTPSSPESAVTDTRQLRAAKGDRHPLTIDADTTWSVQHHIPCVNVFFQPFSLILRQQQQQQARIKMSLPTKLFNLIYSSEALKNLPAPLQAFIGKTFLEKSAPVKTEQDSKED